MELKYFSQHYKINLTSYEDWFDPRMSLDTSLYIDPFMVFKSKHPLFSNAKEKFFDFFKAAFELAHEAISSKLAYQKLEIILKFPEVKEVCLGVSKKGTSGSGSGGGGSKAFAEAFVKLAKAGYKDIKHFEEVEIFTGGIGEDKISDATANIIKLELIEYTQNICKELNVPTLRCAINNASFDFEDKSWDSRIFNLPKNPFFQKERGVILVPKEFLREMHAISSDGFAEYISGKKNEELRAYLNYDINRELKKTDIKKKQIIDFAQRNSNIVHEYVQHLEENEAEIQPYNLDVDKKNVYRNEKKASEFILANPLSLSASNKQEFVGFLERLIQQCKFLMEEKDGYKLLWDELKQLPDAPVQYKYRTESEAQKLLAEIILGYCQASSINIYNESEICKQSIDFQFISGYKGRALIKLQLAESIPAKQASLEKFLADIRISRTGYDYYLIIAYTYRDLERVDSLLKQIESMDSKDTELKLLIINAILDKSIGEGSVNSSSSSIFQSTIIATQNISSNMNLSGQQRRNLQVILVNAFPTMASLEQMLSYELDRNLRVIVGEGSLQDVVFKLIQTANAQGWLEDLVRGACNDNPENKQLQDIAQELLPNSGLGTSPISSTDIPPKETNQLQKILVLAAIPHGLRLDKEIREITEAIRRAANRNLFEIRTRTAVRPQDIRRAIAEEQPQIVHFCGHGLEDGSLLLEDDGGNDKPVTPEGLASLFELHADYVECVVLNACYSEKSAVAIRQYINYTIGMNQPIEDKAAIAFAQGFYDGLSYKQSTNKDVFQRAFNEAVVAIKLENISQGQIPVFKKKP